MNQSQKALDAYAKEFAASVEKLLADTEWFNNLVDRAKRADKLRRMLG